MNNSTVANTLSNLIRVAKGNKVKSALNINNLKIYPIALVAKGKLSTFKDDYLKFLENCIMGEGEIDTRIEHIHELLAMYKEMLDGKDIYIKTNNNFIKVVPLIASTLNYFFTKNEKVVAGMFQMFNGLQPGKTVHLDDALLASIGKDSNTPVDIMQQVKDQIEHNKTTHKPPPMWNLENKPWFKTEEIVDAEEVK